MRRYRLARERAWDDPDPVCGLPEGHPGYPARCASEEVYARQLARSVRRQQEARVITRMLFNGSTLTDGLRVTGQ